MPPFDQNPGYPTANLNMAHYGILSSDFMVVFKPRSETYRLSSNEFESNYLTLTGF